MNTQELETYLQAIDKMMDGRSMESVVLRNGKAYDPPRIARPKGISKLPNKECFKNAYYVANHQGWAYVEGFACSSLGIPTQHAWVLDAKGSVVETTWKDPGAAYYGIELDMSFIHRVLLDTRVFGVLNFSSPTFRKRFLVGGNHG